MESLFKYKYCLVLLFCACILFSCDMNEGDEGKETKMKQTKKKVSVVYTYNAKRTKVQWIAYKTNAKIPVKGTFSNVIVHYKKEGYTSPIHFLKNLSFSIPVHSVDTKNPERDKKISQFFFGAMASTDTIKGYFKNIEGNNRIGKLYIDIVMNTVTTEVVFDYIIALNEVNISAKIHLDNWNVQSAVQSLNTACRDLHKGEDGVSKLWSNIAIDVTTTLDKKE